MVRMGRWAAVVVLAATAAAADEPDKFDQAMAKERAKWDAAQVRDLEKVRRQSQEKLARSKRPEERAAAAAALGRFDDAQTLALLTAALADPDAEVRENAARSLGNLYETSASAEPALRGRLDDVPAVAVEAANALAAMGAPKAELLAARRRALERGTPWARYVAARALVGQVPGSELFPALMDQYAADSGPSSGSALDDQQAENRRKATMESFERIVQLRDQSIVPQLVEALRRMSPGRDVFLRLLGRYEPPPENWRDILISLLNVPEPKLQSEVIDQLGRLTQEVDARVWVPAVGRLVRRRAVGVDAVDALAKAGPLAADASADIVELLKAGTEKERVAAAAALGKIGDRTRPAPRAVRDQVALVAMPALQNALRADTSADVRLEAARAINQLQVDPAVATAALAAAVANPAESSSVRQYLLTWLRNRGGEAKAAQPVLEAYLPRAGDQRDYVELVLASIRDGKVHAPTLNDQLAAKDPDAEQRAHSYLRAQGIAFEADQFAKALNEANLLVISAFLDAGMSADQAYQAETPLVRVVRGPCRANVRPTPENVRESVELLLASGANVNAAKGDISALMHALGSGCDRTVIRTLIKAGARLDHRADNGLDAFEFGLVIAEDGIRELLASGYRMPAARGKELLAAYVDNPHAQSWIRKAMAAPPAKTPVRTGAAAAKVKPAP